jgi:hypothetical protein
MMTSITNSCHGQGAIIIAGSGPTNRWGSDGPPVTERPYLDVAVALALRGVAVLLYDKRTCSSPTFCPDRHFCTAVKQGSLQACSACPGCVDIYSVTAYDYISDATAAMRFLASQPFVNASSLISMGHSEGCFFAPHVALATKAASIVLLEGGGLPLEPILALQSDFQRPGLLARAAYYARTGNPAAARIFQGLADANKCVSENAVKQAALVSSGAISGFSNAAFQVPAFPLWLGGAYVTPGLYDLLVAKFTAPVLASLGISGPDTLYCDAALVNGTTCLCSLPMISSPACHTICERAVILGEGGPGLATWTGVLADLQIGNVDTIVQTFTSLPSGTRVLTTNGWNDANVPPSIFKPLHDALLYSAPSGPFYGDGTDAGGPLGVIFNRGLVSVTSAVFANITHSMYDIHNDVSGAPTPFQVRLDVLQTVANWICLGVACTGAPAAVPPPASAAPFPAWVAGLIGAAMGCVVGAVAARQCWRPAVTPDNGGYRLQVA